MEGIEKIAEKITGDAQAEMNDLRAQTDEKVRAIAAEFQAKADKEREDILARGRRTADERLLRLNSAARMETRKLALAAKQEVIAESFDAALEQLCDLPDDRYIALLTRLAVKASTTGKEQLVFSQKDRARVGKQVVVAANEALVKRFTPELPSAVTDTKVGAFLGKVVNSTAAMVTGTGLLTLSEETRPIKGGFIMLDGDIEINCAFETLVRLQREGLEKAVAEVLFS